MTAVRSPCPPSLHLTEQVALAHQAEHFLVIDNDTFTSELCCHPAVAISRQLDADGFYSVQYVCPFFLFQGIGYRLVVIATSGKAHKLASPGNCFELVPLDEFPFLLWWLTLFCNAFFKNSFSRVSFPTSRSNCSTLSCRAASLMGSLLSLPRLYCFFQWYSRLMPILCLRHIWAGRLTPLSRSSITCLLNSGVKFLFSFIAESSRSFIID